MKQETIEEMYESLHGAVEKRVGRAMSTPRDFDLLSASISEATRVYISPTTLKRFWGYLTENKDYRPRRFTLDLLSMYVGYKDWDSYCKSSSACPGVNSDFVKSPTIYATSLALGDKLKLMWNPDRCVTVSYMGEDMFEVVDSVNSKLQSGDRFCCGCFMDSESLYLSRLVRNGKVLGAYVCGQDGGIKCVRLSCGGVGKGQ